MSFHPKTFLKPLPFVAPAALALSLAANSAGAPWIAPGEEGVRHHLQLLSDSGEIDSLTTVWPLATKSLSAQLQAEAPISHNVQLSRSTLRDRIETAQTARLRLQAGTSREELRGFFSDSREQSEVAAATSGQWNRFQARLAVSVPDSPWDGDTLRLDGSYLAADLGDWRVGLGQIDRWWGPGWQSSLILSNNARPSPGLFIERNTHRASDLPIARLLGPWHLSLFANQLESDRHVPNAKLLGSRLTFKPFQSIELGLSRTAQWGGEGRPESLSNLLKLVLGQDNRGDNGIDLDGSNEPGNQLGGFDWRWSFGPDEAPLAFYGQWIGEDEAGGLPSREIVMFGLEATVITPFSHGRVFLEGSDTTMNFLEPMPNSAYNHSIYQSGYRYKGAAIGASSDNDSRVLTLGGYHEIGETGRHSLTWKAAYASLNRDGQPANHTLASNHIQTGLISGGYEQELTDELSVAVNGYLLVNELSPAAALSRAGIQISMTLLR